MITKLYHPDAKRSKLNSFVLTFIWPKVIIGHVTKLLNFCNRKGYMLIQGNNTKNMIAHLCLKEEEKPEIFPPLHILCARQQCRLSGSKSLHPVINIFSCSRIRMGREQDKLATAAKQRREWNFKILFMFIPHLYPIFVGRVSPMCGF